MRVTCKRMMLLVFFGLSAPYASAEIPKISPALALQYKTKVPGHPDALMEIQLQFAKSDPSDLLRIRVRPAGADEFLWVEDIHLTFQKITYNVEYIDSDDLLFVGRTTFVTQLMSSPERLVLRPDYDIDLRAIEKGIETAYSQDRILSIVEDSYPGFYKAAIKHHEESLTKVAAASTSRRPRLPETRPLSLEEFKIELESEVKKALKEVRAAHGLEIELENLKGFIGEMARFYAPVGTSTTSALEVVERELSPMLGTLALTHSLSGTSNPPRLAIQWERNLHPTPTELCKYSIRNANQRPFWKKLFRRK